MLSVVYFVTARLGLHLYSVEGFATLIWMPAGISLAALILWGYDMWFGVALGSFIINMYIGASAPVALGIATGSTIEAVVGLYLLRHVVQLNPLFVRIRDSLGLIIVAVLISAISATIGVSSLLLGNVLHTTHVLQTGITWLLGDSIGIIVLTPFLLVWSQKPRFKQNPKRIIEILVAFCFLFIANISAFFNPTPELRNIPLAYMLIPLLWISLRGGARAFTLASVLTTVVALSGALSGHELFAQGSGNLLITQIFVGIVSIIFFIFGTNVEERKEAERSLEGHIDKLEQAVQKISSEDQAKTDFLAILAHELRNPLSPIVSALELIKLNGIQPPNSLLFDTIETQIHTIERLLGDLLDITRISHKKFRLQKESVELQSILNHSLETVRPFIKNQGHQLSFSIPKQTIWLNGDSIRLMQIFVNILYNAAKYTKSGGKITLSCKLTPGVVEISIADSGIGIEPRMFKRIFEPFVQASDTTSERSSGLGIGLALSKRLAELHGGKISIASEGKNKGSVFTISLPIMEVVQLAMSPNSNLYKTKRHITDTALPQQTQETGIKILLVDDNIEAANGLQKLLEYSGYTVIAAYTGASGLEAARAQNPDIAILDIGLPDMSGYEVAQRMRTHFGPSFLLIALSGYGQKEDKSKAFAAGFNHHLTKPVSIQDMSELLTRSKHH